MTPIDPDRNEIGAEVRPNRTVLPNGGVEDSNSVLWVSGSPAAGSSRASVVGISIAEGSVTSYVDLQGQPGDPFMFDGRVWLALIDDRVADLEVRGPATLLAIDPGRAEIDDAISIGADTTGSGTAVAPSAVAFDSAWVIGDDGTILRLALADLQN
jgi:hypothetical protein